MEILDAYDLTGSFRDAGELAGCSHHTVARYVAARDAGGQVEQSAARAQVIDPFLAKVEEWVERSKGKVRADIAHDKLLGLGYAGSERTTRRAVAKAKKAYRSGNTRVHRPWVTEPGMWAQYDFGDGPRVAGVKTILLCAWLAWSRTRVIIPILDKTLPSVFAALDGCFRLFGGVPTFLLTDNEKTVSIDHVAGIAVRNPGMVAFARHYGVTVHTCMPADPASKGGTEATVKLAKADLVPTEANLLDEYASFAELEAACAAFTAQVNSRVHRATRRAPAAMLAEERRRLHPVPAAMLAEERRRLHPVPAAPYTAAFGLTRRVPANTPMVTFEAGQYSVPHTLLGEQVWVRVHGAGSGEQIVIVHLGDAGPVEVARHGRATPGSPKIDDAHFPPAPAGALARTPKARTTAEEAFLAIGEGAALWLVEAAAAGTVRMRVKMADAVTLAALRGTAEVDWALGHAAVHERFAEADLVSILDHHATAATGPARTASEDRSLTQGTAAWAGYGLTLDVTDTTTTSTDRNGARR
ncbi:MAG: hypothetical protein QG597_3407 [Actinomycetota bacterium]|nr:hypothetical protein [Actinomycetota bacterium]